MWSFCGHMTLGRSKMLRHHQYFLLNTRPLLVPQWPMLEVQSHRASASYLGLYG